MGKVKNFSNIQNFHKISLWAVFVLQTKSREFVFKRLWGDCLTSSNRLASICSVLQWLPYLFDWLASIYSALEWLSYLFDWLASIYSALQWLSYLFKSVGLDL